ncbi:MAG: hypothetical protein PHH00_02405 [Candidatus Nanoarchaeia archaeon]|nr:hypothetical protein [Candidatus Nanoarchaeia archaeon]
MANRGIIADDFISQDYKHLPLDRVLNAYQTAGISPHLVFSRFQNLENRFYDLEKEQAGLANDYRRKSSELEDLEGRQKNVSSYEIPTLRKSLRSIRGAGKNRTKSVKEMLAELEKRVQGLRQEIEYLLPEVEQAKKKEELKRDEVLDFQKAYSAEMEFVYSQKVADEAFAWARLRRPGKFRIAEPLLIVKSGLIPLESLFDSESLDAVDRVMLAKAKSPDGEYIIPLEFLASRVKNLPGRIKALLDMASDVEQIGDYRFADKDKLDRRIQGLLYERDALYELAVQRTSKGSDRKI